MEGTRESDRSPAPEELLAASRRLSEPGFSGVFERYVRSEPVHKAGDGDLYTLGMPNEYFDKCAFVLTSQKLWALRGAGLFGTKKPAVVFLREIEKIALTRLSQIGKADEVGITFKAGATTLKGGPEKFTASRVVRWQMKTDDPSGWATAIQRACEKL